MNTRTVVAALVAAVVITGTVMASSAFTTATIDRQSDVTVVNDASGQIALSPGNAAGDAVSTSGGELQISLSSVNVDSQYVYGQNSTASAPGNSAFTITSNAGDQSVDLDLSLSNDPEGSDANLVMTVYDDTNSKVGTLSEQNDLPAQTLSGSGTWHVVIDANLTGVNTQDTYDGTLTVSA